MLLMAYYSHIAQTGTHGSWVMLMLTLGHTGETVKGNYEVSSEECPELCCPCCINSGQLLTPPCQRLSDIIHVPF